MRFIRSLTLTILGFAWVCLLGGCVQEEKESGPAAAKEPVSTSTSAKSDSSCPSCCTPLSRGALLRKSAPEDGDAGEKDKDSDTDAEEN